MVRVNQTQIQELERSKTELEAAYPSLTAVTLNLPPDTRVADFMTEQANLAATEAKSAMLRARMNELQTTIVKISELAPKI